MHPKIEFPGELEPIVRDLSRPLYERSVRDAKRVADSRTEVSLSNGYAIARGEFAGEKHLDVLLEDFRRFMSVAMAVPERAGAYPIRLTRGEPAGCPDGAAEAYAINATEDSCEIVARDPDGLRRGVFFLQDEMLLRRAPILPLGETARWTTIATRISRSPIAPYRWLSGWELEDENDYYPEPYLARLAHCGVNGIWVAGLLRNLVASATIPELGPETHRLDKLRRLVAKAARYGIRVYFFCIEPRALPNGHPAAAAHPEIVGSPVAAKRTLCFSSPLVEKYIREAMRALFTEVPDLAGVINIFTGERPTTCWWNDEFVQGCPRCRDKDKSEMLGGVLDAFAEGIHSVSPNAEFLGWTYMMDRKRETLPITPMLNVMKNSRRDVVWLGNFEHGSVKEVLGKRVEIHEYCLSHVGPSDFFSDLAREAVALGRRIYAKLQIGTTYELSTVPHVPVPGIVYEKLAAMSRLGATGAMLGWIPGGFPGPMLKAAGEAAFEPRRPKGEFLRRLAGVYWGESRAEAVASAWERFAEAWQRYPFANDVLYFGPLTRSPAYQLHLEREERLAKPYNWGYERTRKPQPFEDKVERWLGPYSVEEICESFRTMAARWLDALNDLTGLLQEDVDDPDLPKQVGVAAAIRLQCLSGANVYEFYSLRDKLIDADDRPAIQKRMREVAEDDIRVAEEMKKVMAEDSTLGFESELYAYSYSIPMLDEKIRQVRDMLATLARWERAGVEAEVLRRTVEEAELLRPDRWGD